MNGVVSWSVCQVFSKRTGRIQDEVQDRGIGTMLPTYARRWFVDGKKSEKECPLFPGYLLFESTKNWGQVSSIEGVIRVLGYAQPIRDDEAWRLTIGHAAGEHNALEAPPSAAGEPSDRRRRRKPRRSKRAKSRPGTIVRAKIREGRARA